MSTHDTLDSFPQPIRYVPSLSEDVSGRLDRIETFSRQQKMDLWESINTLRAHGELPPWIREKCKKAGIPCEGDVTDQDPGFDIDLAGELAEEK